MESKEVRSSAWNAVVEELTRSLLLEQQKACEELDKSTPQPMPSGSKALKYSNSYILCEQCRDRRRSERQSQKIIKALSKENSQFKQRVQALEEKCERNKHSKAIDQKPVLEMKCTQTENAMPREHFKDEQKLFAKVDGLTACFGKSQQEIAARMAKMELIQRKISRLEMADQIPVAELKYCNNKVTECLAVLVEFMEGIKEQLNELKIKNGINT